MGFVMPSTPVAVAIACLDKPLANENGLSTIWVVARRSEDVTRK
jgi:hypothetical protein